VTTLWHKPLRIAEGFRSAGKRKQMGNV
jgi:hypothetical protein